MPIIKKKMLKSQKMSRHPNRKSSLTILELMLCVALLAIIASVLIFPLSGLLAQHRFNQGTKQFMIHLREMQALAMNHHTDMGIKVYREGTKWMCAGFTDEPMKLFRPFELQNISSLRFDQKPATLPFKLTIYRTGRVSPNGLLSFQSEKRILEIDFRNTPHIDIRQITVKGDS
jgi:Tfp pilus assembly protein FimT